MYCASIILTSSYAFQALANFLKCVIGLVVFLRALTSLRARPSSCVFRCTAKVAQGIIDIQEKLVIVLEQLRDAKNMNI